MGNIIDIRSRLKHGNNKEISNIQDVADIVDIQPIREEIMRSDRRNVKRTILTEFVSLHSEIPGYGVLKIHLYDINEKGLSFDLEEARGHYNAGDEVELRMYLNHQTFFRIQTKIAHITHIKEEGMIRHGCEFVNDSINSEALQHFIKFLESVTASLRRDGGDILVSKINS